MEWKAIIVRGNNDQKLLDAYSKLGTGQAVDARSASTVASAPLSPASIEFLRNAPDFIRIPSYNLIIVHAGVPPARNPEVLFWLFTACVFPHVTVSLCFSTDHWG